MRPLLLVPNDRRLYKLDQSIDAALKEFEDQLEFNLTLGALLRMDATSVVINEYDDVRIQTVITSRVERWALKDLGPEERLRLVMSCVAAISEFRESLNQDVH